jgi:hypothetical protein
MKLFQTILALSLCLVCGAFAQSDGDILVYRWDTASTPDRYLQQTFTGAANSRVLARDASGAYVYSEVLNAMIANGTIDLTTKVTGVLPSANGGFNPAIPGAIGGTTPAAGTFTTLIGTTIKFPSSTTLTAPADGRLLMTDNAGTSFDRLQFGGTTSSYPALKPVFNNLHLIKADDSGFANLYLDQLFGTSLEMTGGMTGAYIRVVSSFAFAPSGTAQTTMTQTHDGGVQFSNGAGTGFDKLVLGPNATSPMFYVNGGTSLWLKTATAAAWVDLELLNLIINGSLQMRGSTSGTITIQPAAAAGTYALTMPTNDGNTDQFLQTNGSGVLTWATAGDMLKSVYDPRNLGFITGDNGGLGGVGGKLSFDAGSGTNADGGLITMNGGTSSAADSGSINLSGQQGAGGSLSALGSPTGSGIAGSLNMDASGNNAGGSITMSAGGGGAGGSINTSSGGGSIDTRTTGSIQLGVAGTRSTLRGNGTGTGFIDLPDPASGTLVLLDDSRTITVAGTANEIESSAGAQNLSANRTWTLSLPSVLDLGGKTSFELPNSAAPSTTVFGHLAGDNNAWAASRGAAQFYDGTANTWLVGVLSSDTPSNGQVPTFNTGGTITWDDLVVADDAITNAKLSNMAEATVKGRASGAGTGDPTDLTADQVSTTLDGATDPFLRTSDSPIKAWVNFDGTTADNLTGTYTRTSPSTTVTITVTNHGHIVGHRVFCDFTTGTGLDGAYEVTSVADANTFTITTAASTTTSGNVTLLRRLIRASSGVQSVVYRNSAGLCIVNLSTAMVDDDYAIIGSCGSTGMANAQGFSPNIGQAPTTLNFNIITSSATPAAANMEFVYIQIIR